MSFPLSINLKAPDRLGHTVRTDTVYPLVRRAPATHRLCRQRLPRTGVLLLCVVSPCVCKLEKQRLGGS